MRPNTECSELLLFYLTITKPWCSPLVNKDKCIWLFSTWKGQQILGTYPPWCVVSKTHKRAILWQWMTYFFIVIHMGTVLFTETTPRLHFQSVWCSSVFGRCHWGCTEKQRSSQVHSILRNRDQTWDLGPNSTQSNQVNTRVDLIGPECRVGVW